MSVSYPYQQSFRNRLKNRDSHWTEGKALFEKNTGSILHINSFSMYIFKGVTFAGLNFWTSIHSMLEI